MSNQDNKVIDGIYNNAEMTTDEFAAFSRTDEIVIVFQISLNSRKAFLGYSSKTGSTKARLELIA